MYIKSHIRLFTLVLAIISLLASVSAFAQTPEPPTPPELEQLLTELDIEIDGLLIDSEMLDLLTSVGLPMQDTPINMDQLPIDIEAILAELDIPADMIPEQLPQLDITDLPIDLPDFQLLEGIDYTDFLEGFLVTDSGLPIIPPDMQYGELPGFPIDLPTDIYTDVIGGEWPDLPIDWLPFPIDFPESGIYTDVVVITDVSGIIPGEWLDFPVDWPMFPGETVSGTAHVGDFPIDMEAFLAELGIDLTAMPTVTIPSEMPFDLGELPIDIEALLAEMGAPDYTIPEGLPNIDFTDIPANLPEILAGLTLPHFDCEFDQPIGAPGSSFIFTGTNLSPNDIATVLIDGLPMGTVATDEFGNVDFALEILDMIGDGDFDVSIIVDGIETEPVDVVVDDNADITPLASDYDGTVVPLGSNSVPLAVGMNGQTAVTTSIATLLIITLLLGCATITVRRN